MFQASQAVKVMEQRCAQMSVRGIGHTARARWIHRPVNDVRSRVAAAGADFVDHLRARVYPNNQVRGQIREKESGIAGCGFGNCPNGALLGS